MPQKVLNPYTYFSNVNVPKIKKEYGLSHKEAMFASGNLWNSLTDAEKKPYIDMSAKDAKR